MTTTKSAIEAGQTLVASYKGDDYTCEVLEHEGRLHYVLPGRGRAKPKVFGSPSAAGREITGSQVNGYRFWSVPEKAPSGQAARQKTARAAIAAAARSAKPKRARRSTAASGASEPPKPAQLIEPSRSQRGVSQGNKRYFCSRCMQSFVTADAGEGKLPEQCPGRARASVANRRRVHHAHPTAYVTCSPSRPLSAAGGRASSVNSPLEATSSRSSAETSTSPPAAREAMRDAITTCVP